jgi:hypothetical protein
MTLSSWLSAAEGDASGFWLQTLLADLFFPGSFVWGEYAATAMLDAQAASDSFSSGVVSANPYAVDDPTRVVVAFLGEAVDPAGLGLGDLTATRRTS